MFRAIAESPIAGWDLRPGRWIGLTVLSAAALICLLRKFHVLVVANCAARHLATASWAFPLNLFATSLFVVPIAVTGLALLPEGADPDHFGPALPLRHGQDGLAVPAFLGGVSSATSMEVVAAITLVPTVSNHLAIPVWLRAARQGVTISDNVRDAVPLGRRIGIAAVLAMGHVYFRVSGDGAARASVGRSPSPAFPRCCRRFSAASSGAAPPGWAPGWDSASASRSGSGRRSWPASCPARRSRRRSSPADPGGSAGSGPRRSSGGLDPAVHALVWSMLLNLAGVFGGSPLSMATSPERLQEAAVVNVSRSAGGLLGGPPGSARAEGLLLMAQRILGQAETQALFRRAGDSDRHRFRPAGAGLHQPGLERAQAR